ncbi:MAG: penicillin-binding protein 2 [Candidatus Latescibacteria bacterium]|nr:penicillin-binding protein 2 [Candidatus Latescibacterota bacterium]
MESLGPNGHSQRLRGLLVVAGLLFAILFARLFYLQIASSAHYAQKSEENRIDPKRIKARRGLILARGTEGVFEILARSRPTYTVTLTRSKPDNDARAVEALWLATGGPEMRYARNARTIRLLRDVDFTTVSLVQERLSEDWPLDVEVDSERDYPYGPLAAHLLGYLGEVQEDELQVLKARNYTPGDFIGKTGLEKVYEDLLRGEDGVAYIEVDAMNRPQREFPEREQPPEPGRDLLLTLDFKTQRAAERALADTLTGAVVALNPQTGAVLAMVSKPAFDPNIFVSFQSQEERRRLLQSNAKPLLNRATREHYPPGSTMKMVAAVAALETGVLDTLGTFPGCGGSLRVGSTIFHCAKKGGHGVLTLQEAIEASCNVYFYHLGQNLGFKAWRDYADRLGFGRPTGIDLQPEEDPGNLPTRQYFEEHGGWALGHMMNLVIGQGPLLATPVQMARYTAALCNGGYLVTPYFYGEMPRREYTGISASTMEKVKRAMRRVVYGGRGTGRRAQIEGIEVGGKSGTAQAPGRDNDAWFVAFAPYDHPEIAVAVVVEAGGYGGVMAGPIARKVMEAYFGRESEAEVAADSTDSAREEGPMLKLSSIKAGT